MVTRDDNGILEKWTTLKSYGPIGSKNGYSHINIQNLGKASKKKKILFNLYPPSKIFNQIVSNIDN